MKNKMKMNVYWFQQYSKIYSGTSYKTSQYKPLHRTIFAPVSYKTMVLYEAMGLKRFIQLAIKKIIEKKMENSHLSVHNVLTDEEIGLYRVKSLHFDIK